MSWSIALIDNTVEITPECAKDLESLTDEEIGQTYKGKLYFEPDHMEHMDYLHDKRVLKVLRKHKVSGRVTFGSLEGDNEGSFWGYEFTKGKLRKLEGQVEWHYEDGMD